MELTELLKKLKMIEPDREYKERSRRVLFAGYETNVARPTTAWQFILQNLQAGSGIALAGILILLIAGSVATSSFSPVQLKSLDPVSLRAEADAIDIQIQLTSIAYEPGVNDTSTPAVVLPKKAGLQGSAKKAAQDLGLPADSTPSMTIDDALLQLSQ